MVIIGIDLAGVPEKETGFAVLRKGLKTETRVLHTDKEIIKETLKHKPRIITIDAPLGMPRGRCCFDKNCSCRSAGAMRKAERALVKMGIRVFPCGFAGMQKLTLRGIKLRKYFEKKKHRVIETYPGSAQDILGMPRKGKGLESLRKALIKYGFRGDVKTAKTDHELDAITSALVGKYYLEKNYLALGDPEEQQIIVPRDKNQRRLFENKKH